MSFYVLCIYATGFYSHRLTLIDYLPRRHPIFHFLFSECIQINRIGMCGRRGLIWYISAEKYIFSLLVFDVSNDRLKPIKNLGKATSKLDESVCIPNVRIILIIIRKTKIYREINWSVILCGRNYSSESNAPLLTCSEFTCFIKVLSGLLV